MKLIKIFTLLAASFGATTLTQAQDLMAREANTDYQLKSSNTAKIIERYQKKEDVAAIVNIYGDTWSNEGVNIYKGMAKPEQLVIALRGFSMPIKSRLVSSNYGYRKRFRRNHYGIDIKGYTGDTIYAAFSGKVRVRRYDAKGFGRYIVIRHTNGLETVYGHLSKQLVNEDEEVKSGQPIGLCGNTGRSYGSHLHFETRVLGEAINPALMFNFAEQDVTADTYTYRSSENTKMPVATPIDSYDLALVESNAAGADGQETAVATTTTKKSSKTSGTKKHVVKKGENPSTIAKKYHMTVAELTRLNRGMKPTQLRPGQTLIVKK